MSARYIVDVLLIFFFFDMKIVDVLNFRLAIERYIVLTVHIFF